ncbi:MAG: hypothetical protein ABIG89_05725 [Candidatus Woesearchaeota archaeon]
MDIKDHIIVSIILALALFPIYGWIALLVFVGGVLIDVDHYLWHIIVKKTFSIQKAYHFMKHRNHANRNMTLIFHNVEFWTLKLILVFFFPWLFPLFIGLASHITLDLINYFKHRKTHPNPIAYSLVHKYFIKKA